MDDEELLIFINRSSYRVNILKAIGHGHKIPSVIAKDAGILLNHISYQLSTLRDVGLVVCINPEYKKGRLYRLTEKGVSLLDDVKYDPSLKNRKWKKDEDEEEEEDSDSSDKKSKKKKTKKSTKSSTNTKKSE